MASSTSGSYPTEVLGRRSHNELRKPDQLSPTYDTCGSAMTSGFPSRGECAMQQFAVFFFTVVIHGLSTLKIPGNLLCSTTGVSDALLVSAGGTG